MKDVLPDAHADFVFAVAGEEFGVVVCLAIVALFAFVVLRGFSRVSQEGSLFVLLAATGLLVQFGLQAAINMASSLHLIPDQGYDLAVSFLRRVIAPGSRSRHGDDAGLDKAPARRKRAVSALRARFRRYWRTSISSRGARRRTSGRGKKVHLVTDSRAEALSFGPVPRHRNTSCADRAVRRRACPCRSSARRIGIGHPAGTTIIAPACSLPA